MNNNYKIGQLSCLECILHDSGTHNKLDNYIPLKYLLYYLENEQKDVENSGC